MIDRVRLLETTEEDLRWFADFVSETGHTDDGDLYRMAVVAHRLLRDFHRARTALVELEATLEAVSAERDKLKAERDEYRAGWSAGLSRAEAFRSRSEDHGPGKKSS